jgi:UDP-glucuronate 4-epimerase
MKKRVGTKKRKVLVTGVAGFIGFHLATTLLTLGWTVIGVDSMTEYYDPRIKYKRLALLKKEKGFRFVKQNIAKYPALEKLFKKEKPDEIVHLAAQAGVRYSLTDPWSYIQNNELGTLNIFEAAKRLKFPRVIYASSSSVYGGNEESPMAEDHRTNKPLAVYGVSKKQNELLAHAYNHLYGTEMIGLRFFTVYGIWGRPDLALFKFTKNILANKPIDVYNRGAMKRSFTHVSDIVAGIVAVLGQPSTGRNEIYNLGGAEAIPLSRFIQIIEKETGKNAKKNLLPMQMGDVRETVADWSKAKRDFGFTPSVSIEEGIAEFVAWFRQHAVFLSGLRAPKQ